MTIETIHERLLSSFPGSSVEVEDLTGTSDHIAVRIVSTAFAGMSRIKAHQAVMAVFAEELKTGELHALTINTQVPTTN